MSKSKVFYLLAIVIGSIGAIGEAYLLWNELENSLPYKVVDYDFYSKIANIGFYLSPVVAVSIGLLSGFKKFWLSLIIPVITCPLTFVITFKIMTVIKYWGLPERTWDSGDFNPLVASQQFYQYSFSIIITGFIIGVICSFLLVYFSREKKLA